MPQVLKRDELFTPERIAGMINLVRGESALAKLSNQQPMAFNGNELFTFTLDNDINVVAESGAKAPGGATIKKTKMLPIKVEYSARFSDELWYSGEEYQLDILKNFVEGYAKKLARGLDLMAMHGVNPRDKQLTEVIGSNHLDNLITQTVTYDEATIDDKLEDAIFMVSGAGFNNTGMAMSPTAGRDMAKINVNGVKQYPEFRFGGKPETFAGVNVELNSTVSELGKNHIYVGDFQNMFKWGYAKNIGLQVHTAGDPDNTGRDLAGHNEILLRSETYLGWGILDNTAFARVEETTVGE